MNKNWVITCIVVGVCFVGIIFCGVGIIFSVSQKNKKKDCTQPVSAIIVEIKRSHYTSMDKRETSAWFPVYEYYVNGNKFRKTSNIGGSENAFSVGQKLTLYLNPENPEQFYCPSDAGDFLSKLFIGLGIFLLLVAVITRNVLHRILFR